MLFLASSVQAQWTDHLTIGLDAELHFNDQVRSTTAPAAKGEFDFHLITLKSAYKIDKHWSVNAKVKAEHAFDRHYNGGDVYVDNAYVKYKKSEALSIKAGIISLPVNSGKAKNYGSVELSPVEKYVAYAWREAGVGLSGQVAKKWTYQATLTTGLNPSEMYVKDGIYNARLSPFSNSLENVATALQVEFKASNALKLGASVLYSDLSHSSDTDLDLSGADYTLLESYYEVHVGKWTHRSTAKYSMVSESEKINDAFHHKIGSAQYGVLTELNYDFSDLVQSNNRESHLFAILRAEAFDTQFRTAGIDDNSKYEHGFYTLGLVYSPIKAFSFKVDYQFCETNRHADYQMFDLGIGYHF